MFHKRLYEVTYFEEREEALFIQTIHVTFLKQLEVGDKPIAWAYIPKEHKDNYV